MDNEPITIFSYKIISQAIKENADNKPIKIFSCKIISQAIKENPSAWVKSTHVHTKHSPIPNTQLATRELHLNILNHIQNIIIFV